MWDNDRSSRGGDSEVSDGTELRRVTETQQQQLWDVIYEHRTAFATGPTDMGRTHILQLEIDTGTAHPIHQHPRRLPLVKQAAADQCLEEMRAAGVVEPSDSPWMSPVVLAGLKLNPGKCKLMRKELVFLGDKVSGVGVGTEEGKVTAVRDWPTPKSLTELGSFLGLASYYRRFIAGFSTAPLNQLAEKNTRFAWGTEQQQAFDTLKTSLCQSPVLTTPDPGGEFVLDTDASNEGLGAVLAQGTAKGERVIAYYSRTFSRPEKNYCVTQRELLAVVEAVNQFKHYLCCLKFLIRTDHASLKWLLSFREPDGQVARWIERLQEYNFTVLHRKGEAHTNADGLSRRPCPTECSHCSRAEDRDHEAVKENKAKCRALRLDQPADWATEQQKDQELKDVMEWVGKGQRQSGRR
ncbi:hypothetical protein DPEC_G00218340 [Dallia pectoralis]|uniref:Uncharacterized protein n=1 Tax=Dallia pectoralis TaxID=75939 RepID=A0ACC2G2Q9_DALPE|nr:hypothetical protein DPEC_G00218340 [Dallia pectoralis]